MDVVSIASQLAAAGLDPRMAAARADLADVALQGVVNAARYADAQRLMCRPPFTPILDSPDGSQISEMLACEWFWVLEQANGWSWGWSGHDHYVGYVVASSIEPAFAAANETRFEDPVTAAEQFLDMPYVWGGRGGAGIDCSGLVQRSMAAVGVAALRDSDMQRETLGELLSEDTDLKRGDVIFFPGHVGMMVDDEHLIHATRYHMKTLVEPLNLVVSRVIRKHGMGILARRRVKW